MDVARSVDGSSPLTAEQTDEHERRYGHRPVRVQDNADRPPRRLRRRKGRGHADRLLFDHYRQAKR